MQYIPLELKLTYREVKTLKDQFDQVIKRLEDHVSLSHQILAELQASLTTVVAQQSPLQEILKKIPNTPEFFHINLLHPDTELLNLPWGLAVDSVSNKMLYDNPQLLLSKNSRQAPHVPFVPTGGPLNILVMISSPKGLSYQDKDRLDFETEERLIIQAFEPLFKQGAVQVDFTDNGSLNALQEKVSRNQYHILHFSGHGSFHKEKGGFLLLEDSINLQPAPTPAAEFARALLHPAHQIPLLVFAACQTAQADTEKGLAGVAGTLLQKGTPGVISMGMSIADTYAAQFTAHLYTKLAEKQDLTLAFAAARQYLYALEAAVLERNKPNTLPSQWIIPNLYLTGPLQLVDWKQNFKPLVPDKRQILFVNMKVEKSRLRKVEFIGRRKELSEILPALREKKPVHLKGQGGIGKTTLALHLIRRLQAGQPDLIPFIFNEEGKSFSYQKMLDDFSRFCIEHDQLAWLQTAQFFGENLLEKITFLIGKMSQHYPILLLFDNFETFQNNAPGPVLSDYEPLLAIIAEIAKTGTAYLIVTGRYPVSELKEELAEFFVNDVELNDFMRKCYSLNPNWLTQPQMEFLYKSLGGNYRFLEFFYEGWQGDPENVDRVFKELDKFEAVAKKQTAETLQKMAKNLIFDQLWQQLGPPEQALVPLLTNFDLPVTELAFRMQTLDGEIIPALHRLHELTLIQVDWDREIDELYYFMPPLVKSLVKPYLPDALPIAFHEQAGRFYQYVNESLQEGSVPYLEAAFWQFVKAQNEMQIDKLGDRLAGFYYARAFYRQAYSICQAVGQIANLPYWCSNRLGLIYDSFGQYDQALACYQQSLKSLERLVAPTPEDRKNLGTTLNNISQIFQARGDYASALGYLERSLKIRQEIGDKSGEGTTLNNISQIFKARGDYATALGYLERSLKIRQEIGDKSGQIPTLHNMAMIALNQQDGQKFFEFEQQAYQLVQETNDAMGLFQVGQTLGYILCQADQKAQGRPMLEQAYQIGKAAGLPGTEEIKAMLDQVG